MSAPDKHALDQADRELYATRMDRGLQARARALAERHQAVTADLQSAAAGYPQALSRARYRGALDSEIARLVRDIDRDRRGV